MNAYDANLALGLLAAAVTRVGGLDVGLSGGEVDEKAAAPLNSDGE